MLIEHLRRRPAIDPTARIAPTAVICGDVRVGPDTSTGQAPAKRACRR
jgi:carbonic anhydrase/acetyltransferase-like protein (isoleucine patch superfamily)